MGVLQKVFQTSKRKDSQIYYGRYDSTVYLQIKCYLNVLTMHFPNQVYCTFHINNERMFIYTRIINHYLYCVISLWMFSSLKAWLIIQLSAYRK